MTSIPIGSLFGSNGCNLFFVLGNPPHYIFMSSGMALYRFLMIKCASIVNNAIGRFKVLWILLALEMVLTVICAFLLREGTVLPIHYPLNHFVIYFSHVAKSFLSSWWFLLWPFWRNVTSFKVPQWKDWWGVTERRYLHCSGCCNNIGSSCIWVLCLSQANVRYGHWQTF